jgi:hypothetical protein
MNTSASFAHVGRYSSWTFVILDLLFSILWYTLVMNAWPDGRAILVGLTIGIVGVIADGGYWYAIKRTRRVELGFGDGPWFEVKRWDPAYIGFWLLFWLDFVIGTNIGTFIGVIFERGFDVVNVWTVGFLSWFLLVALLARKLRRPGDLRIRATRLMTTGTRLTFLIVPAIVYVVLLALQMLTLADVGSMILLGLIAAFAMELPLYVLGWRHPSGHLAAPVANTICEWNSVVPLLYLAWLAY